LLEVVLAYILTLMMIAMKFYLFIPLLFLSVVCLPCLAFTQENITNQHSHSLTAETSPSVDSLPNEHQMDHNFHDLQNVPHHGEIPGVWPHHTEHESDTFQAKFFNMLFILCLLIGFMILASWALRRMMKARATQLNTASTIKVLETRYLSPRATLYLVEVQDKAFLIAESATSVTYLASLPLEEESSPSSQTAKETNRTF
jgi:flagellar biogenesis protein FliO